MSVTRSNITYPPSTYARTFNHLPRGLSAVGHIDRELHSRYKGDYGDDDCESDSVLLQCRTLFRPHTDGTTTTTRTFSRPSSCSDIHTGSCAPTHTVTLTPVWPTPTPTQPNNGTVDTGHKPSGKSFGFHNRSSSRGRRVRCSNIYFHPMAHLQELAPLPRVVQRWVLLGKPQSVGVGDEPHIGNGWSDG
ncbi:hypothetical protein EJ06DRAFT_249488 [Trichodelitschia bisporula]|uniref:Uncharacterized protein n=1 Tax=Trichodelitschia bisporula TaxID=703511 RepID=A0A6G1HK09_9PEZI|nr:hypothetical protein EJ06DRAFT_249488 [Trichodelitschia bisporula]